MHVNNDGGQSDGQGSTKREQEIVAGQKDITRRFEAVWRELRGGQLADHPLAVRLDELVQNGGPHVVEHECSTFGDRIAGKLDQGDPELLTGDLAALRARAGTCWELHYDGLMGPGLGAVLATDGSVLLVWVITEG